MTHNSNPFGPDDLQIELEVSREGMDDFWGTGWRHFGPFFFRCGVMSYGNQVLTVLPLRIVLDRFRPSKSQRRVLRCNLDLSITTKPTILDNELHQMFAQHAQRFKCNVPSSLEEILGGQPETIPCENVTFAVHCGTRLVAASFLDIGIRAVSSVYAIFDPAYSRRSLGIFTMLKEIDYAKAKGLKFYYPGYTSKEPSPYDYKKNFAGLEFYDWGGDWRPFPAT